MIARRVCIARGSELLSARAAWRWQAGDEWVPVPVEREDLAMADATRPAGVHPAHWYGHPKETHPVSLWLVVTADGVEHTVRALSAAGAVHSLGWEVRDVDSIVRLQDWF